MILLTQKLLTQHNTTQNSCDTESFSNDICLLISQNLEEDNLISLGPNSLCCCSMFSMPVDSSHLQMVSDCSPRHTCNNCTPEGNHR